MIVKASIEATVSKSRKACVVTLTGFRVAEIEADWTTVAKRGATLVLVDGLLVRETKEGREPLMQSWSDWVDYWAVDFDFTGTFRSVWQDFRTKAQRTLELETPPHQRGKVIAVQVIDIFANEHRVVL